MGILDFFRRPKVRSVMRVLAPRAARAYAGASTDRLMADMPSWGTSFSANEEIRRALLPLRSRSRQLARDNDYMKAFLRMVRTNVVGPDGFGLQMRIRQKNGGSFDAGANDLVEAAWAQWSRLGVCTVDGRICRADLERLVIEQVARDGEAIVRLWRSWKRNRFHFAVQLLEADRLAEDRNVMPGADGAIGDYRVPAGHSVRMGVELDAFERPVAYFLRHHHPGDRAGQSRTEGLERVAADQILHLFVADRPHAARGVPWVHAGIRRLAMLGGYEEAELVAARTAAAKMGFYTSLESEAPPVGPDAVGSDGTLIKEAEPGVLEQLPPGVDFKTFDPQHPTQAFPFFLKAMVRGVSAGLGVSYNSLASDLEAVNYSSLRQGALNERDEWRVLQSWMREAFVRPLFETWLDQALLARAIELPLQDFERFNKPHFVPRGWQWVDPQREIEADIRAVALGVKTRSQICAERGLDFEEVLRQLAEEQKLAAQLGVKLGEQPQSVSSPPPAPPAAKEDEEDD